MHTSCWLHAERPLHRLVPFCERHRPASEGVRQPLWALYQELKAYRQRPEPARQPALEARFDAGGAGRTGSASVDGVLAEMAAHQADWLRVLEQPEVPLHNNVAESPIREYVTKRKISGSTRREAGRRCRDPFARLKKTCGAWGVNFWAQVQDGVRGRAQIPRWAERIRGRVGVARGGGVATVPAQTEARSRCAEPLCADSSSGVPLSD